LAGVGGLASGRRIDDRYPQTPPRFAMDGHQMSALKRLDCPSRCLLAHPEADAIQAQGHRLLIRQAALEPKNQADGKGFPREARSAVQPLKADWPFEEASADSVRRGISFVRPLDLRDLSVRHGEGIQIQRQIFPSLRPIDSHGVPL
jgi:hypothetical protein